MSRRLAPPPPGTFLLAAVAGTLAWLVHVAEPGKGMPVVAAPDVPAGEAAPDATEAPVRPARPEAFYAAVVERPLFAETRRPAVTGQAVEVPPAPVEVAPDAEPAPDAEAPPEPPALVLKGVLLRAEARAALLGEPGATGDWIAEGSRVGDWMLQRIAADHVELTNSGVTYRIDLYKSDQPL